MPRVELRRVLAIGLPIIAIGAGIGAAQQLNLVGAILSARSLIVLPLLAYLAIPRLAGTRIDPFLFFIGAVTAVNAFLGYLQNHSPADSPINYYASEESAGAAAFEENVRAAGTFSYITGYANLAIVGAWAGLSLLCLSRGRFLYIVFGWGTYLAAFVCALVSISRGTVIIVVTMFGVFAISGRNAFANLIKGLVALIAIVTLGYALSFNPIVVKLTDTLLARQEASEDTIGTRTLNLANETALALDVAPLGSGFGTEQVGGVFAETGTMSFRRFEVQSARLIMEAGVIGVIGFLFTAVATLWVLFRARLEVSNDGLRRVFALTIFVAASFFFTNVVFDHFASFFTWVIISIVLGAVATTRNANRASVFDQKAMLMSAGWHR